MILTDRFTFLNFPRTGSTFVREAFQELYRRYPDKGQLRELLVPIDRTRSACAEGRRSQHGTLSQVPASQSGLPVLSVMRDPIDRALSEYELGFWKEHPPGDRAAIGARFPSFPRLSFEDFVEMSWTFGLDDVRQDVPLAVDVGPQTLHFLRFFSRRADAAIAELTDETLVGDTFRNLVSEIRFLHTEDLSSSLSAFLGEVGFEPDQTAFLLKKRHVNASTRRGRPRSEYFSPELEERFRYKERALFGRFPHYERASVRDDGRR